jgi:hypothetical protein
MSEGQQLDRISQLKQLRDELRLKAHLAKADIKDEWERAEAKWHQLRQELPRIDDAKDDAIEALSGSAKRLATEIRQAYTRIRGAE